MSKWTVPGVSHSIPLEFHYFYLGVSIFYLGSLLFTNIWLILLKRTSFILHIFLINQPYIVCSQKKRLAEMVPLGTLVE